jgi:CheY-like chemotaxis protein
MNNIFLIDDNIPQQTFNAAILRELGYQVTTFSDPYVSLTALEKIDKLDVIFVSFEIPGIYGDEVFNVVRATRPDIPIVVTSFSIFPSPDILRQTPHIRYRLFGQLRKEGVTLIMQSIHHSRKHC